MNKKNLLKSFGILTAGFGILYFLLLAFFTWSVEYYPKRKYEDVLKNKELLEHYSIGDKRNPKDYGFQYEDVIFSSAGDSDLKLNGWYVPAQEKTNHVIIMVHGRTANRMKPMKYLQLFKETGISKKYNIFLPDLRNSGVSPDARTMMGVYFSRDLMGAIQFLKRNYNNKRIILYSFSMGSMASMLFLNNEEYMKDLSKKNIQIEKLIMDSPMSNAKEILMYGSIKTGFPEWLSTAVLSGYQWKFDGDLDKLRLSVLLPNIKIPILIFHGKMDESTPFEIFEKEYRELPEKMLNIKTVFFEKGKHVYLYPKKEYRDQYITSVKNFIHP